LNDKSKITVIDFGGQYTHLIGRRIRDLGVYADIIPFDSVNGIVKEETAGIILSGGPRSVGEHNSPDLPLQVTEILDQREIPVLGICYGHQLLGKYFGGRVKHSEKREYGATLVINNKQSVILENVTEFIGWMSHGDHVGSVAEGFETVAYSDTCPVVALESIDKKVFGVQFHPEVTHTQYGQNVLKRFVQDICMVRSTSWDLFEYKEILIQNLRKTIGDKKVILGVSGGVDSLVASLVLHEAIGANLYPVFIDHGLLRKGEGREVRTYYESMLKFKNFVYINESALFLERLRGITDPEEKRKIIGHSFIDVFEKTAKELSIEVGNFEFLAQGTIYSDRIESGAVGTGSAKIKSHHNLTLPDLMDLQIIEPLKDLYKDEVRKLGVILDAPSELISRYPFPGPGLAVRIIGEVTLSKIQVLQQADKIFLDALREEGHETEIWQAFAVLLAGSAVGVQGDSRSYGHIIALRAVASSEGMTANFSRIPWDTLGRISTKIINEIPEVTRVVYDISTKPPSTIEFE
jgi:GMP synthase (glutamine-hydrolysing)